MNAMLHKLASAMIPRAYKPFTMFPYPFRGEPLKVEVGIGGSGFPFAEHEGMRVYFPKDYSLELVEWEFRVYLEDEGLTGKGRRTRSPHCYVTNGHRPEAGDVILDVGCSEGFFSRAFAAQAKRIYLFESDNKWSASLAETFGDCWDKVTYTPKAVGRQVTDTETRLEDVVGGSAEEVFFLTMDIEGGERAVIESSAAFLTSHKVKMSCCAYHRQDDGKVLSAMLRKLGFKTRYSEGFMLPYGSRTFPFLRRGMIYARNY